MLAARAKQGFSFLLVVIVLVSILSPFLVTFEGKAYVDPPSVITIDRVKIFHGVWEANDWLTVVEYHVSGTESISASSLYSVCLRYDVTSIEACNPIPSYDHGVASIYLPESTATSLGFDWDDVLDYEVRLRGSPSEFDPADYIEGVAFVTYDVSINVPKDEGIIGNSELLGELIIDIADEIEQDTDMELLTTNNLINSTDGYDLFVEAIPGIIEVCGAYFATSFSLPEMPLYTAHHFIYPDATISAGTFCGVNPLVCPASISYQLVNWPYNISDTRGRVSGGGVNFALCDEFEEEDDFWNWATLEVTLTDDSGAPQGESSVVNDFTNTTGRFDLQTNLTAAIETNDHIRIDYSDTYIYTTQTSGYDEFIFSLEDFTVPVEGYLSSIAVHYSFSCSGTTTSGSGRSYILPVIYSGSEEFTGSLRSAPEGYFYSEADKISKTTWIGTDVDDLQLGLRAYVNSGSVQCRVYKASVALSYRTSNPESDYAKSLEENTGNRLRDSLEGLGEWLGVPGMVASSLGVALLYFALAGRIFVATGSSAGAVVLGFPFILACVVVGLLQMYLVFIMIFTLLILFGIVFILPRF